MFERILFIPFILFFLIFFLFVKQPLLQNSELLDSVADLRVPHWVQGTFFKGLASRKNLVFRFKRLLFIKFRAIKFGHALHLVLSAPGWIVCACTLQLYIHRVQV